MNFTNGIENDSMPQKGEIDLGIILVCYLPHTAILNII